MRFRRAPLLHFLLLGGLLFGVKQWWWPSTDEALQTIHLGPAELERLRSEWARDTARTPTPAR